MQQPANLRTKGVRGGLLDAVLAAPATVIFSGTVTVATAGTAVQFPVQPIDAGVTVKAPSGNAGDIYIGPSTVDNTSFFLSPGESRFIETNNLNNIWVDAASDGDVVVYLAS